MERIAKKQNIENDYVREIQHNNKVKTKQKCSR